MFFRLVTSVGHRKNSESPWRIEHQTIGSLETFQFRKVGFVTRRKKTSFFYILRYFDFYVFLLSTNLVSCLFFHFLAINHFFISTFLFRPATQIWYFGLFPFAWNQDIIICCCNSSFLNFDTFVFVVLGEFGVLPCFHYLKLITKWAVRKSSKLNMCFRYKRNTRYTFQNSIIWWRGS